MVLMFTDNKELNLNPGRCGKERRRSPTRYELYSNLRRVRGTLSPNTRVSRFPDERDLILTERDLVGGGRSPYVGDLQG